MATLSLDPVIQINVILTPVAAVRSGFNLGLIIGSSSIINTGDRVVTYTSLAEMLEAGFKTTDAEYLAASIYFAQNPSPTKVAIGVKGAEETALQAVTACREANSEWYACYIVGAEKADIVAVAPYIEAISPESVLFFTTKDADVLTAAEGNIFATLKDAGYTRTLGVYSTKNDHAACGVMGYAMGANTGDPGSAYTLRNKTIINLQSEPLTAAQVNAIEGNNGNVQVNRGVYFDLFEPGLTAAGRYFDDIINLDMLVNGIKRNVMDTLQLWPKIPQTEPGVTALVGAINDPLEDAVTTGYIAPGIWRGGPFVSLSKGDALPTGYLVMTEPLIDQSDADRAARKAPKIYIAITPAGAIESVAISLNVSI